MVRREARDVVLAILDGDPTQIDGLSAFDDPVYRRATAGLEFVLTPEAVGAVLSQYIDGVLSKEATQKWASFVRRGHVWIDQPVIDIAYESEHEAAIVEATGRMDELGDVVDGQIDAIEAHKLVAALERGRQVRTDSR